MIGWFHGISTLVGLFNAESSLYVLNDFQTNFVDKILKQA